MNDFLSTVESYLGKSGISATSFGREVMQDPNFVFDLRKGRDCRGSVITKVIDHIKSNPPENTAEPQQ
tara:strand:- start:90 stop:293 length:204 start_codon:yes stop_codon:yes gene_type:complete